MELVHCWVNGGYKAVSRMIFSLLIGCLLFFFVYDWLRPDNSHNKFKPGKFYFTKYCLFRILLWLNARRKKQGTLEKTKTNRGYGSSITDPEVLESCQTLDDDPNAIDTTYFNGFNEDGISVALRVARKHNRKGEVWVLLHVPGVGFLQHPLHPDTAVVNMDRVGYSAAGCRFELLEPMSRWRVTYNGLLRRGLCNNPDNKPEDYVHVKLSFRWGSINDPFNFDTDCNPHCLADAIAREKWTKDFWAKLRGKHQTHYEQVGELRGTIQIEGHETKNVHMIGIRDHTFGFRDWAMFERYAIHFIWIPETGMLAMVGMLWMPNYITFLKIGFLTYANGETFSVQDVNFDLINLTKDNIPPESYEFSFKAANQTFQVQMHSVITPVVYHYTTRASRILERFCTYTVNGKHARGLVEYHYRNPDGPPMLHTPPTSVPLLTEPSSGDLKSAEGEITLAFTDRACCSSELVGGKGSQLAFLTSIQDEVCCTVPAGFCITLSAFETQIRENGDIESHIQQICDAIRTKVPVEQIQRLCSDTVESLATCIINHPIEKAVTKQLESILSDKREGISFAVRSSAAGEDGSEASSAGQMETYLGVAGVDAILEAVRKCWASAYTYQAVEYRRQHGQPIRTSVGVVIQEMVQSDVSGVLFTNDPVTGSPNKMVIDASYGLGEVVVSGKTTPDTFTIQRLFDDKLTILKRHVGEKNVKIQVSEKGGTKEIQSSDVDTDKLCLTDDQVLQLCAIAIKVENYYGSSRDVEWAIKNDKVYLLQARPITTLEQETDEEFLHEFDTPLVTGKERVTLGNIGEMMPGCISSLTASLFSKAADMATCSFITTFAGGRLMKHAWKSIPVICGRMFINITSFITTFAGGRLMKHAWKGIPVICGRVFINITSFITTFAGGRLMKHAWKSIPVICGRVFINITSFITTFAGGRLMRHAWKGIPVICGRVFINITLVAQVASNSLLFKKSALETNLLGEILHDHTLEMIQTYGRINNSFISRLLRLMKFFYVRKQRMKIADSWTEKVKTYNIGPECSTATELYDEIQRALPAYFEVWDLTIMKSSMSGNMASVAMGVVSGGKEEWTVDNYSDIALLLAHCQDVYSAEVPTALQEMAKLICENEHEDVFMAKTDKECVEFLSSPGCNAELREKYSNFMERHGHRCVREAEFLEKSWKSEPEKLMTALKAIIQSKAYQNTPKQPLSLEEAMTKLKSPIGRFGKFLLRKWIIPKTRYEVGQRELGKSVSVKVADKFKQAFWRLSLLLEEEGRLPDGELMFFLTNREIGTLLKTRSSRLITRAVRRRKILAVQSQIEFPRMNIGRPQPIKKETKEERKPSFTISGMPISQGSVKGIVRVVKSLEDAASIQTGDILVVSYTDVGWSPYFPLISGLITEMGGLISHGAVVAREYGLPCVVNVPNATDLLKTGDFVHIEGATGQIHKLEHSAA